MGRKGSEKLSGRAQRPFELALERFADLTQSSGGPDEALDHVVIARLGLAQVEIPGAIEEVLGHLDAAADPLERFGQGGPGGLHLHLPLPLVLELLGLEPRWPPA